LTEDGGFDREGEASGAWKSFAGRLADSIAGLGEGDSFTIRLAGLVESASPSITFGGVSNEGVRSTVEASAPNLRPDDKQRQDGQGLEAALTDLGWLLGTEPPDGSARWDVVHARRVMARREADELSAQTVRLLCDVFGALHPVFLRVTGEADLVDYSAAGADTPADEMPQPQVMEPVDSEHLRELVGRTIALELGSEPVRDSDGDIMIETREARVFVRVLEQDPVIHIFSRLLHGVEQGSDAPDTVAKLNAEYSFIQFLFADGAVLASVHLPATPFGPVQLRRMLATFVQIAEQLGEELAEHLGGEREIERDESSDEATDEPDAIPPELVTLLGLDPDGLGLDPELTAAVCGHDKALAWQLLHVARGQEVAWRAAIDDTDDPEQEAKCAEEAAGWKATRLSLTRALELIKALPE